MTKELLIRVKVYNNRLVRARLELGLSARQLSDKAGISLGELYALERFKMPPLKKNGELCTAARKLCDFHGLGPDWFWPEELSRVKAEYQELYEMSMEEARALTGQQWVEFGELKRTLSTDFHAMARREQQVLTSRFGLDGDKERDLVETGKLIERPVGPERTRQIEYRALKGLRRRATSKNGLSSLVEDVDWTDLPKRS